MTFIFLTIILFFTSCTPSYYTGTVQREEKSFLRFIGNTKDVTVFIDDYKPFKLHQEKGLKSYDNYGLRKIPSVTSGWADGSEYNIYQVDNGKHRLKIYRGDNLIVNRVIFIEDHATMEISVP